MTATVPTLMAALDPAMKPWAQIGCGRSTYYEVLAGSRVSRRNALLFIVAARERLGGHVDSINIGGQVHHAPDALESMETRLAQLESENARLRSDNVTLSRIAYRRIVVGGVIHN